MTSFNKLHCTGDRFIKYWLIIKAFALLSPSVLLANFNQQAALEAFYNTCSPSTAHRAAGISPGLKVDAGADQAICFGERAELRATATGGTPPYTFSWSNGGKGAAVAVNPTVGRTIYTLTVTDAAGLSMTDEVRVDVNPLPVAMAGEAEVQCRSGEAILKGSAKMGTPPYNYRWSTNDTEATIKVRSVGDTDYFLTVTDRNGCADVDMVNVPQLSLEPCFGQPAPLHPNSPVEGLKATAPELYQNAPNPFSEQTQIWFQLPEGSNVTLVVRDVSGKIILQQRGWFGAGTHRWAVHRSELPASGYFYYSLQTGQYLLTKQMLLIR